MHSYLEEEHGIFNDKTVFWLCKIFKWPFLGEKFTRDKFGNRNANFLGGLQSIGLHSELGTFPSIWSSLFP